MNNNQKVEVSRLGVKINGIGTLRFREDNTSCIAKIDKITIMIDNNRTVVEILNIVTGERFTLKGGE